MAQRRPLVAGNWKMNAAPEEARALALAMAPRLRDVRTVESVVCPAFLAISAVREVVYGSPIKVGAQDAYEVDYGAFTGAVSAAMLARLVEYVIAGHSERRHLFGDTDDIVHRKTRAILRHGMAPIVCVGERLEERDAGRTAAVITSQLHGSLGGLEASAFQHVTVAYEPVWAIGAGRAATADQAQEAAALIRSELRRLFGEAAQTTRILYGGSVNPANCAAFFAQQDIDGALVGGASLKPDDFVAIVESCADSMG